MKFELDITKRQLLMNAVNVLIWKKKLPNQTNYTFVRGFRNGNDFTPSILGKWWVELWIEGPRGRVGVTQYLDPVDVIVNAGNLAEVQGLAEPS